MKLTLFSSTHDLCPFFPHYSKPQCMLKRSTQSVYLLCQSSSFEVVYSFLFCILATLSSGVSENIVLGKKSNIHFVNSGNKSLGKMPLCHSQTVYQQCPIIYVRKTQLLVSQLLHITLLAHFSEHPMNFQFEAITTTNINFQILHCQVHSFEARLTLILG